MSELDNLFNFSSTAGKTLKDSSNVGTRLHTDDSELILLVDPDQESLVFVVENSTTVGPVTVEAASLQESVSLSKMLTF
jgi:hypothetical protein